MCAKRTPIMLWVCRCRSTKNSCSSAHGLGERGRKKHKEKVITERSKSLLKNHSPAFMCPATTTVVAYKDLPIAPFTPSIAHLSAFNTKTPKKLKDVCICSKIDAGCAYSVVSVLEKHSSKKVCCAVGTENEERAWDDRVSGRMWHQIDLREGACVYASVVGVGEDVVQNLHATEVMCPASWVRGIKAYQPSTSIFLPHT
jgi:hypothetical protein